MTFGVRGVTTSMRDASLTFDMADDPWTPLSILWMPWAFSLNVCTWRPLTLERR